MTQTHLALFDDSRGHWGPLADLRPVFDIRTGMFTNHQRITAMLSRQPDVLLVNRALTELTKLDHPGQAVNALPHTGQDERWLLIHAGAARPDVIHRIARLQHSRAITDAQGRLVAASLSTQQLRQWMQNDPARLPPDTQCDADAPASILTRPWDIQAHLQELLEHDLAMSPLPAFKPHASSIVTLGDHAIKVAPDARVHPMTVLNAEKGAIVIDSGAVISSFCVIAGPCYVGQGTIITPHTHLRANCSIGPACIIGGEVSASVIQSHTNKCHAGYLGNSYVGQWVNLGADTNVSNLKNTFGDVRMQLDANLPAENSRLNKLGPIIGDYARTAIGSRLLTGSCISTGAMIALSGYAPKFVDRFSFLTDDEAQFYDMDKFIASVAWMMDRRDVPLTQPLRQRLHELAMRTTLA